MRFRLLVDNLFLTVYLKFKTPQLHGLTRILYFQRMYKKKQIVLFFRTPPDTPFREGTAPHAVPENLQKEAVKKGRYLLCRQCLQVITQESEQIEMAGAHRHTFANPHGIVFEIGCFRTAAGCGFTGPPTDEFTWFKGFVWRVAFCSACQTHLGWLFTSSGNKQFLGLILDRLIESE